MSPTPDVIFVDSEPAEPAIDARAAEVQRVTNALLQKQQMSCGKICATCDTKCPQLQEWIDCDKGGE
jgi:hypothetical protein